MLLRLAGIPASIAVVILALLLHVEEPGFIRIFTLQFFWQSLEAGVCSILAFLPLVWVLARRPQARMWTQRLSRHALRPVLAACCGMLLIATLLIVLAYLSAITLRINTVERNSAMAGLAFLVRCSCFAAPLAALAPGLSALGLTMPGTVFVWLILLAMSLGVAGFGFPVPLDRILGLGDVVSSVDPTIVWLASLSTFAGLFLSWAANERKVSPLHAHRNPR